MTVYFLSGLGADERTFQKLIFPNNWSIKYIQWLPVVKGETLSAYVKRISLLINTNQNFAIVGLSFGGIIATELNKIVNPEKIIIISSLSTKKELPAVYKFAGWLQLNKIIPAGLLNKVYPFTYWYFGVKSDEEKLLLKQIINETSSSFLKWAINKVINWDNDYRPQNLIHIHGTADRIFPFNKTKADIKIQDGGHFMVYTQAKVINEILINELS